METHLELKRISVSNPLKSGEEMTTRRSFELANEGESSEQSSLSPSLSLITLDKNNLK